MVADTTRRGASPCGGIRIVSGWFGRLRGLIGRRECADALVLVPCRDVHTLGMRDALDVAFVAEDGMVLESRRGIAPGRRVRNTGAVLVVERLSQDGSWLEPGDRLGFVREGRDHENMPGLRG